MNPNYLNDTHVRDGFSFPDFQDRRQKALHIELHDARYHVEENLPKVVSMLFLGWVLNALIAIGPRRIIRAIHAIAHVVMNLMMMLLLATWFRNICIFILEQHQVE